ncbi:MAG: caspase family protein [Bacteroidaceae bacterium]|nr:caspase family protein [Bacteroidaceae bacterium]
MKRALLIGINNYPGHELKGCVEDIQQVKAAIEKNGDGTPNFDVMMMPDVQTSAEVMESIQRLFNGDGEAALLYFSGHGFVNDTGAEIVMPRDTVTPGHYYMGIQMRTIMDVVNNSKVRNKIVILDCCHSGNMGKYKLEDSSSHIQSGVSILTACRDDEYAEEIGGHGVFTELLCTALNGGAADYCGNITVGGIYSYIDRSLGAWQQRPVFKTNVTEFAPLKKVEPQVPLSVIRELTNLFSNPTETLALDPSFEDTNDPSVVHVFKEPYADQENVAKFKILQKLQSIGFVKPVDATFMYFAAMESKGCNLTALGRYYWRLVNDGRI